MRIGRACLAALGVAAIALAVAGGASAVKRKEVKSGTTVGFVTSGGTVLYSGVVFSTKAACISGRNIALSVSDPPPGGKTTAVGFAQAGAAGAWEVAGNHLPSPSQPVTVTLGAKRLSKKARCAPVAVVLH
jgi:hypothetical protein